MKQSFIYFYVFIAFSCSSISKEPNEKSVDTEFEPTEYNIKQVELIDSLKSTFYKSAFKVTKESKGGAGDCYGIARELTNNEENRKLIIDRFDCGDYGFTKNEFHTINNNLAAIKEFEFEWIGDSLEPYRLTERIYYFTIQKAEMKYRTRVATSFSDTTLLESHVFANTNYSLDSLLSLKTINMAAAFDKESLDE